MDFSPVTEEKSFLLRGTEIFLKCTEKITFADKGYE